MQRASCFFGALIVIAVGSYGAPASAAIPLEQTKIVVPEASGQARWGTAAISRTIRRELATGVQEVLGQSQFDTARKKLGIDARSLSPADLAKIAQSLDAQYLLRVVVDKKGWLYTARATLVSAATGELQMNFEVGYYKPEDEAADRGERIGKRTLQKLAVLLAAQEEAPPVVVEPPVEQPPVDTSSIAIAPAVPLDSPPPQGGAADDPFATAFDTDFEAGVGARSDAFAESPGFGLTPEWSHTGRIEARYQGFFSDSPLLEGKDRNLVTLGVRATIDGSLSRRVRIRVLPMVMADLLNQRLFRFVLEEGYLEAAFDAVEVRVGWDALTWGSASTINIVDIINSRDFSEGFFESTKIGQPMIALRFPFAEHSLRLYYFSPFVEPTIPRLDSAFFPLPIPLDGPGPLSGSGRVEATTVYGSDLEEWAPEAAARLSLVIDNVDLSFSYFYGYNRFPLVDPRTIELIYPLIHQVSVDGQWLADPWLLKWEVASVWHQETDVTVEREILLPGHRVSWVAGIERTFEGFLGGTTFTPIVELVADSDSTWFTDHRPPDDFSRIFQNHLTVAFRLSLENRVNSEITASDIIDLTHPEDHVITVEYSERWFQHFTFSLGGRIVNAHPQSKIIALEQLSGFFTRIRLNY